MIVAGVMSGTSADGINVALIRISRTKASLSFKLLGHAEHPYPKAVRRAVLSAMNATSISVADLSRLNFLLAELYAEAVLSTQKQFRVKAELIGCHGQTIYHQGERALFLGRKIATTWQTGEGAIVAARVDVPVVSDFRPADMAVGGKGAPLVPFLDYLVYRDRKVGRILQNIGGIGNLTAIPANASSDDVVAFDTGPGNMVMDALAERLFQTPYDRDGRIAAQGKILKPVIAEILRKPFFLRRPPKTAGREEFGREFVAQFLRGCGRAKRPDIMATAAALTVESIRYALEHFVLDPRSQYRDFVVAGGGAKNPILMKMLGDRLPGLGLAIHASDEFGVPAQAKEAIAFAVMAYQTWNRLPSNVPSATGARRPAVLGKISYR